MILGLITGLIIAAINMPLARFITSKTTSPAVFALVYFPLGLISVILGFVLLSLFLNFSPQVYWFVGLMAYASIAGDNIRTLRAVKKQQKAQGVPASYQQQQR